MMMKTSLSCVLGAALGLSLACGGAGDGRDAPGEAPGLSSLSGVWYALSQQEGVWSSRDWCEADRQQVHLSETKILLGYGQDADEQQIVAHRAEGDALVLEGRSSHNGDGGTVTLHRLWWSQETGARRLHLEVGAGGETWVLAQRADLAGPAFRVACCAGPEGEIPEEYALVPDGTPCPPAP